MPGIGAYTAGAILSLAYHQREAILDGNLVRIFSRLYALDFLPTDKSSAGKNPSEIYWNYAREMADSPKAYMHNEALMELGRTVCKVRNPECSACPLRAACRAAQENRTAAFPPAKKHVQKDWHGTVLVIESMDHKILAVHGGKNSSRTSSRSRTSNHRETQQRASPRKPKNTSTPTRCSPSKAQASSGTASPSTRWNATYCTSSSTSKRQRAKFPTPAGSAGKIPPIFLQTALA